MIQRILNTIFSSLSKGSLLHKPKSTSTILDISQTVGIKYSIGNNGNNKTISINEIISAATIISQNGYITQQEVSNIINPHKPCNKTSLIAVLKQSGLSVI